MLNTLEFAREQAKNLKDDKGIKMCHAYHIVAKSYGYNSWNSFLADQNPEYKNPKNIRK